MGVARRLRRHRERDEGVRMSRVDTWEYLIIALPQFEPPTNVPGASAAVQRLNEEGQEGWEAIGMTTLSDSSIAVLCKRLAT
jgi:hypothetical protein